METKRLQITFNLDNPREARLCEYIEQRYGKKSGMEKSLLLDAIEMVEKNGSILVLQNAVTVDRIVEQPEQEPIPEQDPEREPFKFLKNKRDL